MWLEAKSSIRAPDARFLVDRAVVVRAVLDDMLVLVVAGEVDVQQARVLEVGWRDREQALLLPGVRHLIGDVEGWFVERPAVPDDPDPSRPLDDVEVGAAGGCAT